MLMLFASLQRMIHCFMSRNGEACIVDTMTGATAAVDDLWRFEGLRLLMSDKSLTRNICSAATDSVNDFRWMSSFWDL